jgi:hypothetical protein
MRKPEISTWVNGELLAPDERWRAEWQHEMAAISEGLCPVHHGPLDAVTMPPRRIVGHCQPCRRFWGYNLDDEQVGWWLDHDPRVPEYASTVVPEWMRQV